MPPTLRPAAHPCSAAAAAPPPQVLDDRPDDSSLDAHISAVSMKLQILSADLNDDLERSMSDVRRPPPPTSLDERHETPPPYFPCPRCLNSTSPLYEQNQQNQHLNDHDQAPLPPLPRFFPSWWRRFPAPWGRRSAPRAWRQP